MEQKKRLPVGIDDFQQIRTQGYYYVDKTGLIRHLLVHRPEVTLFARPRHFGSSLNMSMLAHFFSMDGDKSIFDGLEIAQEKELCEKYMGKYPVIHLNMSGIGGETYEEAFRNAADLIVSAAGEFRFLLDSENLTEYDKRDYRALLDRHMDSATLIAGLKDLTWLLERHFGKRVIVLLDGYDAPLEEAVIHGYHGEMMSKIAGMLSAVLKTNTSLEFGVLTGSLRFIQESYFSGGLNNWMVRNITDWSSSGYFGFTEEEVKSLFSYYGCPDRRDTAWRWYGGYQYGNSEVSCPRDVIRYCSDLLDDPDAQPRNDWLGESGGSREIRRLAGAEVWAVRGRLKSLMAGETARVEFHEALTCTDLSEGKRDWSVVLAHGYLTPCGREDSQGMPAAIPNQAMREVFTAQIRACFEAQVRADPDTLNRFYEALRSGDADEVEELFQDCLYEGVLIPGAAPDQLRENFYGRLLTVLNADGRWRVKAGRESGDGYAVILAVSKDEPIGIVIGMKYAQDGDLEQACRDALSQGERLPPADAFQGDGVETVLYYGIGCCKNRCKVMPGYDA